MDAKRQELEERITSFLLGDLPEEQAEEVRKLLDEDESCRALAEELNPTLQLLGNALAADVEAPATIGEERKERVRSTWSKPNVVIRFSWPYVARIAAVLVVCLLMAALLLPAINKSRELAQRAEPQSDKLTTEIRPQRAAKAEVAPMERVRRKLQGEERDKIVASEMEQGPHDRASVTLRTDAEDTKTVDPWGFAGQANEAYSGVRSGGEDEAARPVGGLGTTVVRTYTADHDRGRGLKSDAVDESAAAVNALEPAAPMVAGKPAADGVTRVAGRDAVGFAKVQVEKDGKAVTDPSFADGGREGGADYYLGIPPASTPEGIKTEDYRRNGRRAAVVSVYAFDGNSPAEELGEKGTSLQMADGDGLPVLGDVPVAGKLFKKPATQYPAKDSTMNGALVMAKLKPKAAPERMRGRRLSVEENTEEMKDLAWVDSADGVFAGEDDGGKTVPLTQSFSRPVDVAEVTEGEPEAVYTVRSGDTLTDIAEREESSVSELARLNQLADVDRIVVGQELKMPARSGESGGTAGKTAHVTYRALGPDSANELKVTPPDLGLSSEHADAPDVMAEAESPLVMHGLFAGRSAGGSRSAELTVLGSQTEGVSAGDAEVIGERVEQTHYAEDVAANFSWKAGQGSEYALEASEETRRWYAEDSAGNTMGRRGQDVAAGKQSEKESRAPATPAKQRSVEEKLEEIVIPSLDVRNARIDDVINLLVEASREAGDDTSGLNVILHAPGVGGGPIPSESDLATIDGDEDGGYFFDEFEVEGREAAQGLSEVPTVTLNLRDVSMLDALQYVTEVAGLKYRIDDNGVVITPADVVSGDVVTRRYPAQLSWLDTIIESPGDGVPDEQVDAVSGGMQNFFKEMGIPFPAGTSLTYDPGVNEIVVANTAESHYVMELLISELRVEPEAEVDPVFRATGVNPYIDTAENPFSTFAIDVDTAAYTLTRNYMNRGMLPPAEAVRTEEFVNFFDYDYAPPGKETFAIYAEAAPTPFGEGQLLKVGVKGKRLGREEQQRAVLTFVVDTSGSMDTEDRLGLLRESLRMLVERLDPDDQVALVQYGSQAVLALEHTPVAEKAKILEAIDGMQTSGSTHLEQGLNLGYEIAARAFEGGSANRVLLLSDGVANLGSDSADQILTSIGAYRGQGLFLSVFGFGIGTYNDAMLETLANRGDGTYQFIDSAEEARRVFVDELAATLNTIAKDVKIQVEFNPQRVKRYRQLGYENRQLTQEEFRDDTVDAGEVGSGQSVTALYEILPQTDESGPLGTIRVRYRDLASGRIEEIERAITAADLHPTFEATDARFKLAASVAEFSEILRGNPFAAGSDYEDVATVLRPVALDLSLDQRVQELLRLVHGASSLPRASE